MIDKLFLPEEIAEDPFFGRFQQAYREQRLSLPTLPDVAVKLRNAIQRNGGLSEIAEILQLDPSISAKLVQVANSPFYAPAVPITNCADAVRHLGLAATRTLVMSLALKGLFRSADKALNNALQLLWKDALYLSTLCFVLAKECGGVNAEDALLAGMVAELGAIPLISFAEFDGQYPKFERLQQALPFIRAPVGLALLQKLGFPPSFMEIPERAEDWFFDSGPELSLVDIVLIAKWHSLIGRDGAPKPPPINTMPVYSKLRNGRMDAEASLAILKEAKSRIAAIMAMLK